MQTLNKIAYSIADSVGQPLNHMMVERIKYTIKYYRAEFIRQDIAKNGVSAEYLQTVTVPLQRVDEVDFCNVVLGCDVLRTINKIPKPVRKSYTIPFKYVGYVGFKGAFSYRQGQENTYAKFNKFTGCSLAYDYKNGYIYVYNNLKLKYITVQDVFIYPEEVNSFCSDDNGTQCYNDDMDFPMPEDMLRTITQGIRSGELRMYNLDDKEIELVEDKK